jgi:hypothetical protein
MTFGELMMNRSWKAIPDCPGRFRPTRGGLIGYKRIDGTFLRTLNTDEGLVRKLAQPGIALKGVEERK